MKKVSESKTLKLFTLMSEACHAFEKIAGTAGAHIRFSYKGKKDRIVLACEKGMLSQIVAKGETSKNGDCIAWKESEFKEYTREQAFLKFFDDINKIEVSHPKMLKTWDSVQDFEKWLKDVVAEK
ncbi:MAG: hypothetical protein HQ549_06265 [Candidatus Omnitrophica bacterium]|nr:hypothetical protein [Candidatus Omnitrophota bacterium]